MTSPIKKVRPNFTRYPLVWLAICFAIGIFFASITAIDWKIYLLAAVVFNIITFAFARRSLIYILVFFAFAATGAFSYQAAKASEPKNALKNLYDSGKLVSGDPVEIEGIIQGKPELAVGGFYIRVSVNKVFYKGNTHIVSGVVQFFAPVSGEDIQHEYDDLKLNSGVVIRIGALLLREEKYLNPGGVSFVRILDQKGIDATGIIKSPLLVEILSSENTRSPISMVYDHREVLIEKIRSNFSVSTSGILIASLLGNKHHLTKETADIFRDGGTFHVLVISGLHITFIGGLLLVIVRTFTRRRFLLFVIPTAVLWIYALAVGAETPVVRAAIMFTILMFSYVLHRNGTLLNALGACALLIFVWEPQELFSQSFHLTFVSLFGIVAAAFPLVEKLRAIGSWSPTKENPFPPAVPKALLVFCETVFWSERSWQKTLGENVWDCRIFKSRYAEWLETRGLQKALRRLFEGILITVVVQLFLLPFLVVYFHRVSFGSVILNLWVSIFIVFQNGFALFSLVLGLFSEMLSLPFIKITELFNSTLMVVPRLFIAYDLASFRLPVYSGISKIIYVVYYLPLIAGILILNMWDPLCRYTVSNQQDTKTGWIKKLAVYSTSLIFAFIFGTIILHPYSSPKTDGRLTVDFLDVGQGDSALVTFPNGETMLIDGGGKHKFKQLIVEKENGDQEPFEPDTAGVGETVVSEFLWEKGYSRVDYILATHADADHMQGLISVAKNFEIKRALIGVESPEDETFIEFNNVIKRKQIPILKLDRGRRFEIGGVTIEVLNPLADPSSRNLSSNSNSIVVRMTFGSKRFLFTGDIERETEFELVKNSRTLMSHVVKVAHHGSRTSSTQEFIDAAEADYAVVPVGRRSPFGHPNDEVVERWEASGAKVLTTGSRGTITISTSGKDLDVQTFQK